MKTIHLIRHAKSSWSHSDLPDVARPLNNRGQEACRMMAAPILDAGCSFENVFCSIAQRAQSTIEGLANSMPEREITWQLDEELYTFDWDKLLQWVHRRDESLNEVVIVGHNPAITEFCNKMGQADISNVPTCGYAQLTFPDTAWRDLRPSSGKLVTFLTPKTLL